VLGRNLRASGFGVFSVCMKIVLLDCAPAGPLSLAVCGCNLGRARELGVVRDEKAAASGMHLTEGGDARAGTAAHRDTVRRILLDAVVGGMTDLSCRWE